MNKQPCEIKSDYKKVTEIKQAAEKYLNFESTEKSCNEISRAIICNSELEEFQEEAIEMRGVLKQNYKNSKI